MTRNTRRKLRQLTLRGFSPELEARLRRAAEVENLSINQVALHFLERGAGLSERRIGTALDAFIGTWTEKQGTEVLGVIRDFERLDL